MNLYFEKANENDAEDIVNVQNQSFYMDYIDYGSCPAYGRTKESVVESMKNNFTYKIVVDSRIVGKISAKKINDEGEYHLECLCVIPEYENQGIGKKAIIFIESQFPDAKYWSLETPADKSKNHHFYKGCGYHITGNTNDGVELVILFKEL